MTKKFGRDRQIMTRQCRVCGIKFIGYANMSYCDQTHGNAANFGQPEPFREQADRYNAKPRKVLKRLATRVPAYRETMRHASPDRPYWY